ncbi:MAG: hypothetical protein WAM81_02465 [Acidimicrobiia bacterium]
MPSTFKPRIAIVLIVGIFLIPILVSSLRGLTHVLTCSEGVEAPFTVFIASDGSAVVTSSATGQAGDRQGLCGGLSVAMRVGTVVDERLALTILVTNNSPYPWRGTVDVSLNKSTIPVSIGRIEPGETGTDSVPVRLDEGVNEMDGSLLVGP